MLATGRWRTGTATNASRRATPGISSRPGEGSAVQRGTAWLALLVFLLVLGVFLPTLSNEFVSYDDPTYVTDNFHVQSGLTWESLRWAFTSTTQGNWHPLTLLSHMTDCALFDLKPWGHHLHSALLHALNAGLAFMVWRTLTGA